MRKTAIIDASVDEIERAKETVLAVGTKKNDGELLDLFYTEDLEEIEAGIKTLNEAAGKSWLLSALLLFSLVYNKNLYQKSGLAWSDYIRESRQRLGIDQRDITEQLAAASFFTRHRDRLLSAGYDFSGSNRKLARAELAVVLSGSVKETIEHLASDTWAEFKDWYSSFKTQKKITGATENNREDIRVENSRFFIGEEEAVIVSEKLSEQDRSRINGYLTRIFEAMKNGLEPAIVEVYDKNEAQMLPRLRDKYRQGR